MAAEQDWPTYADQAFLAATDTLLARTAAGAGVEIAGDHFMARRTAGGIFIANGAGAFVTSGATFNITPDAASGANGVVLEASFAAGGYGPLRLRTGNADRQIIRADGSITVGSSISTGTVQNGNFQICHTAGEFALATNNRDTTGAGQVSVGFIRNGAYVGSISTTGTATAYNTSSDYRLKEDLRPVESPLARLLAVRVWNFAWKATGTRTDGFMAHELADAVPCAVTGEKDGMQEVDVVVEPERKTDVLGADGAPVVIPAVTEKRLVPNYQGIDQAKLVPLLTAAVQELAGMVDDLRAEIAALKAA